MPTRLAIGCMTGTSIDALDAALVRIEGAGLDMRATLLRGVSRPLADLAPPLRALANQEPTTAADVARLAHRFALAHVEAIRELLGADRPDLIAIHGQTVFHAPPVSWQLFNPAPIAHTFKAPVVFDLRAADLAAGGQGAPITPLSDWIMFRESRPGAAVVNLGGFCNITLLATDPRAIRALDVCPCNHLLDAIARKLFHSDFDQGGARSLAGAIHEDALADLDGVLASLRRGGRSLGTGDESLEWVSRWRSHVKAEDLAATACAGIASVIAEQLGEARDIALAGGGRKNAALVQALRSACTGHVAPIEPDALAEFREAAAMAILGALGQDRVPITLPQVTGVAAAPISGHWVLP